jgi:TniQ
MRNSELQTINPWVFRVTAYPGESFGHFMSRFRRANHLSSGQLSTILGLRYIAVSYWETPSRRRMPDKKDWKSLSDMTGLSEARLRSMLMPKHITLCLRTRLCALCYGEVPFHRLIWQNADVVECDRHGCELLSMCPQCGIDFQSPALWESGQCERCYLPFYDMDNFCRSAEQNFSPHIF